MGSTLDLCRRDNTEHWPHVASLTGEHHPCATPNSTACYISPTSTPSAYCQPGFLPAIFRSANTNVHSRAAQLNTETYLQSPPLCLQARWEATLLALICTQSRAPRRARSPPLPGAGRFSASLVLGVIRDGFETILSRRVASKSPT